MNNREANDIWQTAKSKNADFGRLQYRNNRGIAILITLTIITIIITASLELHRKMRFAAVSTAAARDRVTLTHMASSGINAAMAMLVKDKNESTIDSIQEDWANSEKINELLKDIPFENGKTTLTISDELARIQVNALVKYPEGRDFNESQRIMWDRLLRLLFSQDESLKEIEPTSVINSVKDWLDFGDNDAITGLNGAESEYYQDLDPPYSCRNGPIDHLGELVLIKGITRDLYQSVGEMFRISRYMTIYGITSAGKNTFTYKGKININTAELPVLIALLPSENEDFALLIFNYRQETTDSKYINDLSDPAWYKNAPGCSDIQIDPGLITASSDLFRIESTATLNEMETTTTAVVRRETDKKTGKWMCRVLSWQTE